MPFQAPYELWMDIAPIQSAIGSNGTVTVTTSSAHGLTPGAYVQLSSLTAAGTAFNGVAAVATVTSGTAFTCVIGTASGTATVTTGCLSYDLMNPLTNYAAGTARAFATYLNLESFQMSANGDGTGSTMAFSIIQDVTPSGSPWFLKIPDNTRFRLVKKSTGETPATDSSDVLFLGMLTSIDARLTESGQGTISDIQLGDVNVLLDKAGIFGKIQNNVTARYGSTNGGVTRSSNVTTIRTTSEHGFVVGQKIKVSGVAGGANASFNGTFSILASPAPTAKTFAYTNAGNNATNRELRMTGARSGTRNDRIVLTAESSTYNPNLSSGDTVNVNFTGTITGFSSNSAFSRLIRGTFSGDKVIVNSAAQITIVLSAPYTATWGSLASLVFYVTGVPVISDATNSGQSVVTIPGGLTEDAAIGEILSVANAYKSEDYPFQRLLSTSDTSQIVGANTVVTTDAIQFSATSLRSAMDTIIETFTADARPRRYFIDLAGRLNYEVIDSTAQPLYPDAPYALTTNAIGSPNTSTTKATVNPYNLSVTWDHDTTKQALFNIPALNVGTNNVSRIVDYDDISSADGTSVFPTRAGAPKLAAVVDYPTAVKNPGAQVQRAAQAFYHERYAPLLTARATLRGGGTAAWNSLGFFSGYGAKTIGTIASASRTGSTVTITTSSAHGVTTGNTVIIAGITGAAGTSMNGTFTVTVTTTTAFTYTAAGTAGSGTVTSATGYAYVLIPRWEPGQYCEVVSSGLGLNSTFRVEEVSLTLEPGSYNQIIDLTLNRKSPSDLANIIATINK